MFGNGQTGGQDVGSWVCRRNGGFCWSKTSSSWLTWSARCLASTGFEVFTVANAQDALRHLTCCSPCDILLTDIKLAGSVDGTVLARLARELRPNLPVVYASGSYRTIEELDAVSGAIFVPKPYNPDKLCEMLSAMTAH